MSAVRSSLRFFPPDPAFLSRTACSLPLLYRSSLSLPLNMYIRLPSLDTQHSSRSVHAISMTSDSMRKLIMKGSTLELQEIVQKTCDAAATAADLLAMD